MTLLHTARSENDTAVITTVSPFTGNESQTDTGVQFEKFLEQLQTWKNGELVQRAFPTLNAGMRELLMTGITPDEWDEMFGGDED